MLTCRRQPVVESVLIRAGRIPTQLNLSGVTVNIDQFRLRRCFSDLARFIAVAVDESIKTHNPYAVTASARPRSSISFCRMMYFCVLPFAVAGNSSTNRT